MTNHHAPELSVSKWLNTKQSINLAGLRGRVVVIEAFQMLCPGCVSHGLPQAQEIARTFSKDKVMVIGLHTVFEHHDAMGPTALKAFLHEYRIGFPVGIDMPGKGSVPQTMQAYGLQGTPSLVLIDPRGYKRAQYFGETSSLRIGADIGTMLTEQGSGVTRNFGPEIMARPIGDTCNPDGCSPSQAR